MYALETFLYRIRKNVSLKQAKSVLVWGEGGSKTRLRAVEGGQFTVIPSQLASAFQGELGWEPCFLTHSGLHFKKL